MAEDDWWIPFLSASGQDAGGDERRDQRGARAGGRENFDFFDGIQHGLCVALRILASCVAWGVCVDGRSFFGFGRGPATFLLRTRGAGRNADQQAPVRELLVVKREIEGGHLMNLLGLVRTSVNPLSET